MSRRTPAAYHLAVNPDEKQADEFIRWLFQQAGLDIAVYRAQPLERRLPACLRVLRVSSTHDARLRLQHRPDLLQVAIGSLLLGVTEFLRDPQVFMTLAQALPNLPGARQGLRIWSASCSDGSELYSVAILLAELGLLSGCDLLGTDCRPDAIAQAQRGVYAPSSLQQLTPLVRQRYFNADGPGFRVVDLLRAHTRFGVQDLFRQEDAGPWDVILWRNTAIYLKPAAARRVWRRLAESLRPNGILVTGKAERPDCDVPLVRASGCIFVRTPSAT